MIGNAARGPLREMLATFAGALLLKELTERAAESALEFSQMAQANAVQGTRNAEQSIAYGRMMVLQELVQTLGEIADGQAKN